MSNQSNHEVLESVANAYIGEEVKGSDLIALVMQQKPEAKASAIFPAAADINTTAPSSAPYRKFLRKVGTGKFLVLPLAERIDGVTAKKAVTVAPVAPVAPVAAPDSFADVPANAGMTETETETEPVTV